jgi:hypothetical protein
MYSNFESNTKAKMSPAWKIHHPREQAKGRGIFVFHEIGDAKIRCISP